MWTYILGILIVCYERLAGNWPKFLPGYCYLMICWQAQCLCWCFSCSLVSNGGTEYWRGYLGIPPSTLLRSPQPLFIYHKLGCSGGIWCWHPFRLLTSWKAGKSTVLLFRFMEFVFLTSFVPVLQTALILTTAFNSLANVVIHQGLSETFTSSKVINFILQGWSTSRNTKSQVQGCSMVILEL